MENTCPHSLLISGPRWCDAQRQSVLWFCFVFFFFFSSRSSFHFWISNLESQSSSSPSLEVGPLWSPPLWPSPWLLFSFPMEAGCSPGRTWVCLPAGIHWRQWGKMEDGRMEDGERRAAAFFPPLCENESINSARHLRLPPLHLPCSSLP